MKIFIITLILNITFINLTKGQSIKDNKLKVDSLTLSIKDIDNKIKELTKTKLHLQSLIAELNQQTNKLELENTIASGVLVCINHMGGTLRDNPNANANEVYKLKPGDSILVYNIYEEPYFKAAYKQKVGFISYSSIVTNKYLDEIIKNKLIENNPKLAQLAEIFGKYNAERILRNEYWIGMSSDMARESLGNPDDVNKSTGSWGIHEQWIYKYKKLYLYFEDGILTSTQN